MKNFNPRWKCFNLGLKYNSFKKIENLGWWNERRKKVKPEAFRLFRLDIYILRLFLTLSYNMTLLAFESQFLNSMEFLNSYKYFVRLICLSSIHLKRACEVAIFTFFVNKQGICACVVLNFHPGLRKIRLYGKFEIFIPGWNFISA